MIIQPKIRGFICTTAHPLGCAKAVEAQINYVKAQGPFEGPKKVLIIGASTGYGLASRIVATFGFGAETIGVFMKKRQMKNAPLVQVGITRLHLKRMHIKKIIMLKVLMVMLFHIKSNSKQPI